MDMESRLKQVIEGAVADGEVPCCTLLLMRRGQEELYLEAGFRDIEAELSVARDSIFRLYSMTKPVTAAAVMILLERGLLELSEPVSKYLPGFADQLVDNHGKMEKVQREMVIFDLLNMTGGLVYDGEHEAGRQTRRVFTQITAGLLEKPGGTLGTVEAANRLGRCPLAFHPGTSWAYGCSADVAGAIVEVVSGMRLGAFMEKEIFGPLGMQDTGFFVPPEKQSRLVKAYGCESGNKPTLYTGCHLGILNAMDAVPIFESGGAGLVSTLDDYCCFTEMLHGGGTYGGRQLLKPGTAAYLTSGCLNQQQQKARDQWPWLNGFTYSHFMRVLKEPGQAVTLGSPGEYGWDGWLGCYFTNAPREKLTIMMMTQKKDAGTMSLTRKIRNIVYSEMLEGR